MFGFDDVAGSAAAILSQGPQMLFNARQAADAREWQQQMAGNAYQWRAEDMRAAGLNPILAATQGVSLPGSGAQASIGGSMDMASSAMQVASARKMSAEADISETNAKVARDQLKAMEKSPSAILDTLPAGVAAPIKAIIDTVKDVSPSSAVDFLRGVVGGTEESDAKVRAFLKGNPNVGSTIAAPATAVEAGRRSGVSVLPGGAVVKRGVPGQLNILRLKAGGS